MKFFNQESRIILLTGLFLVMFNNISCECALSPTPEDTDPKINKENNSKKTFEDPNKKDTQEEVGLDIKLDKDLMEANKEGMITIKNTTNHPLNLHGIQVQLTSMPEDCKFTLGKVSGVNIDSSLAEILGQEELPSQADATFTSKLETNKALGDDLLIGGTVVFLKPNKQVLVKKYLLFQSIESILQDLKTQTGVGLEDIQQQVKSHTYTIEALMSRLVAVEQVRKRLASLSQKFQDITNKDIAYQTFSNQLKTETHLLLAQDAVQAIETSILNQTNNYSMETELVKKRIGELLNDIQAYNTDQVIKVLAANNDSTVELSKQSIRGLYKYYHEKLTSLEKALNGASIADPALPSIGKSKALLQQLITELPSLKTSTQELFTKGFDKLKEAIKTAQDAAAKDFTAKKYEDAFLKLAKQIKGLQELEGVKGLLKNSAGGDDVGIETADFYDFIVAHYLLTARQCEQVFAQDISDADSEDLESFNDAEQDIELIIEILEAVKNTTRPLTNTAKQDAMKIADITISVLNSLASKNNKGENFKMFKDSKEDSTYKGKTIKQILTWVASVKTNL